MKKTSLIINVILIVAVAALYVLFFSHPGSTGKNMKKSAGIDTSQLVTPKIVYVNIDTLLANYDMFTDFQNKLSDKQKASEDKLNTRGQKWQNKVTEYQNNLKRGLVTRSEAQKIEQQLSQEQQEIMKMKNDLSSKLMEEQQVSYRKVLFSVVDYLNEYSKLHHYQYVLSTTLGGNLLYGDKNLDITRDVVDGLNLKYKAVRDSVLKAN